MLGSVLAVALFFGCNKENPVSPPHAKTGNEALLIVVENNNLLDSLLSTGYYARSLIKIKCEP
jgi:hypothetical protein